MALKISRIISGQAVKAEFRRAYTADLLHVLIAKHIGCDEFYTFDGDIKKLESHPKIDPMKIIKY